MFGRWFFYFRINVYFKVIILFLVMFDIIVLLKQMDKLEWKVGIKNVQNGEHRCYGARKIGK